MKYYYSDLATTLQHSHAAQTRYNFTIRLTSSRSKFFCKLKHSGSKCAVRYVHIKPQLLTFLFCRSFQYLMKIRHEYFQFLGIRLSIGSRDFK